MNGAKRALVLHLAGSSGPLYFAVTEDVGRELTEQLPELVRLGSTQIITMLDGTTAVVNFSQVATAHVGPLPQIADVYGNTHRQRNLPATTG
jgi:hypothetical protein